VVVFEIRALRFGNEQRGVLDLGLRYAAVVAAGADQSDALVGLMAITLKE
jgi:hypothetical protein